MKNKGFTLIEILGVVTILAVIMLIAVQPVTKMIKNSKEETYEKQLDAIVEAARLWGNEHREELPQNNDETLIITISQLQQSGYLDEDLVNPETQEPITDDQVSVQVVKRSSKHYGYYIVENNK